MTDTSPRLSLPFLEPGQAQKEITHNEALQRLDMLTQAAAVSADITAPPTAPAVGGCWIVAAGASGAWTGREGQVAQWTVGGWRFAAPQPGWRCHVTDRGADMIHDGMAWRNAAARADGLYIDDHKVVGSRRPAIAVPTGGTTTDSQARSAINDILTTLRAHGLIEMS